MRFKVYIDKRDRQRFPHFFWCSIWPTLPDARARMAKIDPNGATDSIKTAAGACYAWYLASVDGSGETVFAPEMGEIVLAESWSGSSTIAHECSHAAFRVLEMIEERDIADDETPEERHCTIVGNMTRQIVQRLIAVRKKRASVQRLV